MSFSKKIGSSRLGLGLSFAALTASGVWAASFEAVDAAGDTADARDPWVLELRSSANVVSALAKNRSNDVYLDRPIVSLKLTSPSGKLEFSGIFNLESMLRRETTFDGHRTRHVIENLTSSVALSEKLIVTGGVGTVAFLQPSGSVVSQTSYQDEIHQLRERLFLETAYVLENGTTVQLSVFDGTRQKAVDVTRSFGFRDFYDPRGSGDSTSGAIKIDRPLGDSGLRALLSYALVRNPEARGGENHMVAMGLDATYELGEWVLYGLLQFVQVWGNERMNSVMLELVAEKGKSTLYGQVEYTQVPGASRRERVARATIGAKYKILTRDQISVSPFAEIYVEDRASSGSEVGLILGSSLEFGRQFEVPKPKSE